MALIRRKNKDLAERFPETDRGADSHPAADSGQGPADMGAGDLVKLFHSLPRQNFDAEIAAVVRTIVSFDINIENLIDDITHQELLANKRLKVLELEVQLFNAKIKTRQKEMDLLQIGVDELAKSKTYLQHGLQHIDEKNKAFTRRITRKRASKLNKIPELDGPISIADKIKIAASQEIEHVNKQSKVKSLRNKFKKRFARG